MRRAEGQSTHTMFNLTQILPDSSEISASIEERMNTKLTKLTFNLSSPVSRKTNKRSRPFIELFSLFKQKEQRPSLVQAEIGKKRKCNELLEDMQNPPETTNYLNAAENLAMESPAKRKK